MTDKQKAFINAYFLNNFNATKAAEVAGYAHPGVNGFRIKNEPEVSAEIEKRFKEQAATADEVLAVLGSQLRGSIADVFVLQDGSRYPIFNPGHAFETGGIHNIKKLTKGADGSVSVEMYSRHDAAVTIGRHLKMWTDKTEHSGKVTVEQKMDLSVLTPDELNELERITSKTAITPDSDGN